MFVVKILSLYILFNIKIDSFYLAQKKCHLKLQINIASQDIRTSLPLKERLLDGIKNLIQNKKYIHVLSLLKDSKNDITCSDVNYLSTEALRLLGDAGHCDLCNDILEIVDMLKDGPDSIAYTAAMSLYIKNRKYKDALHIFARMKEKDLNIDAVTYICAIRATGFINSWRETIEILNEAYEELGDDVLHVTHTAMINLKYETSVSSLQTMVKLHQLIQWLKSHNIAFNSKTMDIILAVSCIHGSIEDIKFCLSEQYLLGLKPTLFTYNTLLHRYALEGRMASALKVVQSMKAAGYDADETTYNTLLKVCVKTCNTTEADKILTEMASRGIPPSPRTKSLLLRLNGKLRNDHAVDAMIDDESDASLSPHMLSIAIDGCRDWHRACVLLERGVRLNKADEAVYVAAARKCSTSGQSQFAFRIIDAMLTKHIPMGKFTFSYVLTTCLDMKADGVISLKKYLNVAAREFPALVSNAVCQRVVRSLSEASLPLSACQLHCSQALRSFTCSPEVLSSLFSSLQDLASLPSTDTKKLVGIAEAAFSLLILYANGGLKRKLLRTQHFNNVLRLLGYANDMSKVETLLQIMAGPTGFGNKYQSDGITDSDVDEDQKDLVSDPEVEDEWPGWYPTTFTVAESVSLARRHKRPLLADRVVRWAIRRNTYFPPGVVSDVLDLLYSSGNTDLARCLYKELYAEGASGLNHWTDRERLLLDLHGYNRAMVVGALSCAFTELSESERRMGTITIITGTSINREQLPGDRRLEVQSNTFRLSSEVQRVLVEDFYPPISSSTAPNNLGRIIIRLADVTFS